MCLLGAGPVLVSTLSHMLEEQGTNRHWLLVGSTADETGGRTVCVSYVISMCVCIKGRECVRHLVYTVTTQLVWCDYIPHKLVIFCYTISIVSIPFLLHFCVIG